MNIVPLIGGYTGIPDNWIHKCMFWGRCVALGLPHDLSIHWSNLIQSNLKYSSLAWSCLIYISIKFKQNLCWSYLVSNSIYLSVTVCIRTIGRFCQRSHDKVESQLDKISFLGVVIPQKMKIFTRQFPSTSQVWSSHLAETDSSAMPRNRGLGQRKRISPVATGQFRGVTFVSRWDIQRDQNG